MELELELDEEKKEKFTVDSDMAAEWCLKKIAEAQAEHDRLMKLVSDERKELDRKAEAIERKLASDCGYFKSMLYSYFEKVPHRSTKTQESYKLLSGSLVYKKPQVKIVQPEDDRELIGYLKENAPGLVKVTEKAAWGDFKKFLTITAEGDVCDTVTGEVLSFVRTEETAASFDVKLNGQEG